MRKVYTHKNPPKSGNALKAWNWLTRTNFWEPGYPPRRMYRVEDKTTGDKWIGEWGAVIYNHTILDVMLLLVKDDGTDDKDRIAFLRDLALKPKQCAKNAQTGVK